jgi:hypothetical protein
VGAVGRYRESHKQAVRAYCQSVCSAELVDQAIEASFIDLARRLREQDAKSTERERLLLRATRSAAGRFEVIAPDGEAPGELCSLVPELLAARANGELKAAQAELDLHLHGCRVCARTEAMMAAAEPRHAHGVAVPGSGDWLGRAGTPDP